MDADGVFWQGFGMPHDHDHPHSHLPSDPALRVKALETLLTNKGLVNPAALDEIIDLYQNKIGPQNGAKVVAKMWRDPEFHKQMVEDPMPVLQQMGLYGRQGEHMVFVENTDDVHNMVVCTLCSCYPWPLLGIPPGWYKSDAYRARSVREPRAVLAEFGVTLSAGQKVRVWDSTAEVRYLVVPQRPIGTEGFSQEELAALVSRDSMIGTALAQEPGA
ncbi:nitrile hydratase [Shimia sagamensis]|uniref:nitrile hydratase n=2 Tax=Shimia sagamensis TaxID=1566352 RepID=A0ABY1P1X6_9RHOB|nr:nitrile hydratase [Shimia sagamensis]